MNPSDSEAQAKAQSQREEEELNRFLKWAAGLGISDCENPIPQSLCLGHSLAVSYFPEAGGRGLAALRPISRGELILKVPNSALITTHSLSIDQTLSLLLRPHPSLSPVQVSLRYHICLRFNSTKQ